MSWRYEMREGGREGEREGLIGKIKKGGRKGGKAHLVVLLQNFCRRLLACSSAASRASMRETKDL